MRSWAKSGKRAGKESEAIFGTCTNCEVKASVLADLLSGCWGNIINENPAGEMEEI